MTFERAAESVVAVNESYDNEREHEQRPENGVEKQYAEDVVTVDGEFLHHIVETQAEG